MQRVRTLICPDGVIGLNGWQYLLDNNNKTMKFRNIKSANLFLLDNGYTQEYIDEWIEITELIKEGVINE